MNPSEPLIKATEAIADPVQRLLYLTLISVIICLGLVLFFGGKFAIKWFTTMWKEKMDADSKVRDDMHKISNSIEDLANAMIKSQQELAHGMETLAANQQTMDKRLIIIEERLNRP